CATAASASGPCAASSAERARARSRLGVGPQPIPLALDLAEHLAQDLAPVRGQEDRVEIELAHRAHGPRAVVAHDVDVRIEHDVLDPVLACLDRRAVLAETEE